MKKIENFMLPEHTNTLYENEAISSIWLTKNVADKINELVAAYNELKEIDLERQQLQDGKINKAVVFMKDNLLNSLNDLMVMLRDSGFIDDRIEYHCNNLKSRLDNLLGNIKEGSTTLDAELIDIRYGSGVNFDSAGDAIRAQIDNIREELSYIFNILPYDEIAPAALTAGYIDDTLSIHEPKKTQNEVTTDFIKFDNDSDVFLIKTYCKYPENAIAWLGVTYYDEYKVPYNRTSEETITEKIVIKPDERCAYFRVSTRTYSNGSVIVFKKKFENICNTIPTYQHKYNYEYLKLDFSLGYFNGAGEIFNATPHGAELYSNMVKVTPGEKYAFISNVVNNVGIVGNHAGYLWGAVAFYDAEGNYLYRPHTYTVTEETADNKYNFVGEFIIPAGVGYIRVTSRTYWNGTINLAKVKNLLNDATTTAVIFENATANIKGVAHRGLSSAAPENTIAAYRVAKEQGFYYVECDVRFTSDNVPVLLHDSTVDRTSNGTGEISALSLSAVKALDFGSWFSSAYVGTQIPTFEEFILLCKKIGLHPYIELKAGTQEQITNLYNLVKSYDMQNNVTWIGGSPYITYIPQLDSKARIGIVVSAVTTANIVEATRIKTDNNEVFMDSNSYSDNDVNLCRDNGIGLEIWTLNNENTILNLNGYISGVTSDSLHAGIVCATKF